MARKNKPQPTSGATTINGSSPTVSTLPAQANAIITFVNNIKAAAAKLDEEDKMDELEDKMGEYLEILTEHITRLLEIKEGEKPSRIERNLPSSKGLGKFKELFSDGIIAVKDFFKDSSAKTLARQLLKGVGKAHFALVGLVVVANILEMYETRCANREESLRLMKEIKRLVDHIRSLRQLAQIKQEMENVIREATVLIVEGSILCCTKIKSPGIFKAATKEKELAKFKQELEDMERNISLQMAIKIFEYLVRLPPFDGSHHPVGMEQQLEEAARLLKGKREENALAVMSHAFKVGMEKQIREVASLLKLKGEPEENALAVILHGFEDMGQTLGNAVYAFCSVVDKSFKYSKVLLINYEDKNRTILEAQKLILNDLGVTEMITEIRNPKDGQDLLRDTLKDVAAFIFIDNANVLGEIELRQLLPDAMIEAKKVRWLLTASDKSVRRAWPMKTPPKIYEIKNLSPEEAMRVLKRDIKEGIDDCQLFNIIERCGGIPMMLTLVGGFIRSAPDKLEAYHQFMKDKYLETEPFDKIESLCRFAFHHLPRNCQEPFLDICFFFRGWDWNTVEDIVGKPALDSLEARKLVTKDTNGVVSVHNVILSLAKKMATKTRFNVSNAGQMEELVRMEEQDIENIKGIWVESENTDLFRILATKLNSMNKSLRVLHLGNSRGVNISCDKVFGELIFLQGAVPHLPFEAKNCKQLKYLSYQLTDSKFCEMLPPSLTHIELDGSSTNHEIQIYSQNPQDLKKLRILKFKQFPKLKILLDKLGVVENGGLQELTISKCESIEELPQSITKLKSLKTLNLHGCKNLKRLPRGFEELSSLTSLDLSFCEKLLTLPHRIGYIRTLVNLSINNCPSLTRIPESIGMNSFTELDMSCCSSLRELPSRFGGLQNLISLNLSECTSLENLPQDFGQLKCLVKLNLSNCSTLKQLCCDFHCLSSLQMLDLSKCERLEELPQNFHRLPRLKHLYLSFCYKLEGYWMNRLLKMQETLQNINIKGSSLLENNWQEIHRNGNQSCSFKVYMQEGLGSTEQTALLSKLDKSLIDKQGNGFHISSLPINTISLFMFHSNPDDGFPFPLIEEVIDYNQNGLAFKMFYIGKHYSKLHIKVKDNISGYSDKISEFGKSWVSTLDTNVRESWLKSYNAEEPIYLKLEVGDTGSSDRWKVLSKRELEEFVLGHCERYMKLKKLVECSSQEPSEESNLDLLRELFATSEEGEAIFLTKYASDKDSDEPFIRRVDELKGKTILLEMGSEDLCDDIGLSALAKIYLSEKDRLDLEIISIPMVDSKIKMKERFSKKVPWLVLRYPLARAVRYFLVADCGWKGDQLWYGSVFWVINPDGTISICTPFMLFMLNMWKPKISSSPQKVFEELARKEWDQLNAVSNLEFLFRHLENVSNQVKGIRKMICIYDGNKEVTCSLRNIASSELKDSIHIIYIPRYAHKMAMSRFTDSIYKNYNSWEKPKMLEVEMQAGMPLLNLSEDDAMRFWMRILFLKEEIKKREDEYQKNGIDNNDIVREMKTLLHPFLLMQEEQSVVFMDEDGKMIANCRGDVMEWIFKEDEGEDRAKRLIKQLIKVSKVERESGSMISTVSFFFRRMISTVSTNIMQAARKAIRRQENVNSISEYTSDLLELVQLNQLLNFNKEGSGSSTPNWPAPKGFHERLKSSPFKDTSMIAKIINSGGDILETLDLESLVKKVSDKAHCHVLLVADILGRFEHVCGAYRNECLILLEEMNRLSQYINKHLNEQPEKMRNKPLNEQPEKMRRATKWLVHCYIMCYAQIHETSNNIMCCAQIREPSNNIMCCAQIRKPSNNIMCCAQIRESSNNIMCCAQIRKPSSNIMCCAQIEPSKFARFFKGPVNGKKMLGLQQWLRTSQEELRTSKWAEATWWHHLLLLLHPNARDDNYAPIQ